MSNGSRPETTGRFVVVLRDSAVAHAPAARARINDLAGLRNVASSKDFTAGVTDAASLAGADALHFESLGIMILDSAEAADVLAETSADVDSPILTIEPEYIAHPTEVRPRELFGYLRGYRDAAEHIYSEFSNGMTAVLEEEISQVLQDTTQFTWGLQAIGAHTSSLAGQGVKLAILDTGLDLAHPDFIGRQIETETFAGVPVQDVHGHGTHCAGTACGARSPASGVRRYGVAHGAHLHVGKVFNNAPRPQAPTGAVVAGIDWAMRKGCRVASLSLGIQIDQALQQYEAPIRRALDAGTLVVAAAGNNARRDTNDFGFVEPPANADAAMAVAAVDGRIQIANFSARSSQQTGVGGIVNIAAPGVAVFSSVPAALGGHDVFNGTSMATPHVAGVAALLAGATGDTGQKLWNRLLQTARPLKLLSVDVGAGLVQAPQ
jgi:subtilisin family serine protease